MDKLKMASSSLGERLKTGSAQMSRMISSKMKEILQDPTPESKLVDEATSEMMEEPNWGLNLRICAMINSEEISGTEIVKAIKKKLLSKSSVSQLLSLELLEACTSNCEKVFSEVASEKVLEDMVKVIEDPKTDDEIGRRIFEMVRAWGENEDLMYLPVFHQTYMSLKTRGVPTGATQAENFQNEDFTLESYMVNEQMMAPPNQYPIPETNDNASQYNCGSLTVEDNKEFLVVTRNSLDLLSSILDSGDEPTLVREDLTVSMLEKCKQSLPVVQRIAESTNDDEAMLFEALNLNDELTQIISRCEKLEASLESGGEPTKVSEPMYVGNHSEVTKEDSLNGDANEANLDTAIAHLSLQSGNHGNHIADKKADQSNVNAEKVDSPVHVGSRSSEAKRDDHPNADTTELMLDHPNADTTEFISDLKKPNSS